MSFSDFAVAIRINTPDGKIVVVEEPSKPAPMYKKFPGGGSENNETPEEAAARETEEETGLIFLPDQFRLVTTVQKRGHKLHFFEVDTDDLGDLKKIGDEGEIISIADPGVMFSQSFLPPQRYMCEKVYR